MKTRRTLTAVCLCIVIIMGLIPAAIASASYSNFSVRNTYRDQFTDVSVSDWFASYVRQGYEFGLIQGSSDATFSPSDNLRIGQAIALAARIFSIYSAGALPELSLRPGAPWFEPYINFALDNGIIETHFGNPNAFATRREVAVIFQHALPPGSFAPIREVADGAIPDVAITADYASAVYMLYRAGVLSGSDRHGTFNPDANIRRSEIAAIIVRIAEPARRSVEPIGGHEGSGATLSAAEIAEIASPAVFQIQAYAFTGDHSRRGNAFFISDYGLAITSFELISNSSQVITSNSDWSHPVVILDTDPANNLALIRVPGTGFCYLALADTSTIRQGETVFSMSSSFERGGVISQGIISAVMGAGHSRRLLVSVQTEYPGSVLLNDRGEALGVFIDSANVALIDRARPLNPDADISIEDTFAFPIYSGPFHVVDFGRFTGAVPQSATSNLIRSRFQYSILDFQGAELFAVAMVNYQKALTALGFQLEEIDDLIVVFTNDYEIITVEGDYYRATINIRIERVLQFYSDFPSLADFGWLTGVSVSDYTGPEDDGRVIREYIWSGTSAALTQAIADYHALLIETGFVFTRQRVGYLFENETLSVAVVVDDELVIIDILPLD
ncbi:MAG: S-layer homology domain-containing protein [Oscillospiraceae bacterium]|nr:S-layer homology domain-containing protein [Oscillospiraceae bacterium]